MSAHRLKRNVHFGGTFHDRIPLEEDFEVIQARTASLTNRNNVPTSSERWSIPSSWTLGTNWAPEDNAEFSLDPDNTWYEEALEVDLGAVLDRASIPNPKRVRSQASARPHVFWKEHSRDTYLDELIRHDGRGDFTADSRCPDCLSKGIENAPVPEFRCRDCFLPDLTCKTCFIRRHKLNPFHTVQKWNGSFFIGTTLKEIGLVVQLNHASMKCPMPARCHENLLVIHTTGVHDVALSYCGCNREISRDQQLLRRGLYPASRQSIRTCVTFSLLRLLHTFSLMGKISTYDMYRSIERLTNNTSVDMPPDRYRPTMRCLNQWRHLKCLKRAGRGHDEAGPAGMANGELAIPCPSCPHPGVNLPEGWDQAPKEIQFLYTIFVCMDANFRLKNHLISNFSADPGLSNGMAYMVPRIPYEAYVLSKAGSEDISTCVGFQALAKATTQNTRGLRYTGVGGAMCGRSEMILPNAIVNLQKGERYANMDYVFASAIKATTLLLVAISYDIVCQWFIHVFDRMSTWPKDLQPRKGLRLRPLIPKFHEPAHLDKAHEQYSFNLAEGAGLTDGECPERVWGSHNALAPSTRTTGPGTRDDILDDHFGHWNWLKYSRMGYTLLRRYRAAIADRNIQREAHRGFTLSLPEEKATAWELMCASWDADGFPKSAANPFHTVDTDITEEEVQRQLGMEEDALQKKTGKEPLHKTSALEFLVMGLELEDSKCRLKILATEQANVPKSLQTNALKDQRKLLAQRMQSWEVIRSIYMPGLLQLQTDSGFNAVSLWSSNPNPEEVELWLPSDISSSKRHAVCTEGLLDAELQLRTAQCSSSLQGLRRTLRVKTRMIYFKNKNVRGQKEGTRSRSIIDRVHRQAIQFVQKYRAARQAKLNLEGPGDWEHMYRVLLNEDIRGFSSKKQKPKAPRRGIWEDDRPAPPQVEEEEEEDPDLNDGTEGGPPPRKRQKLGTGETRKELSWIWQTSSLLFDSGDDDILRAEWSRSRARVQRATEEVLLVREEMRRVLEFLEWRALRWDSKASFSNKRGKSYDEGFRGYALQQSTLQRKLLKTFQALWCTPLAAVDGVLIQDNLFGDNANGGDDYDNQNNDDSDGDCDDMNNNGESIVGGMEA